MTRPPRAIARLGLATLLTAFLITAVSANAASAEAQGTKTPAQDKKTQVDINSADLKTIETLPGIGPVLAQRIIEGRPYKTLADLAKVKGMSKAKIEANKDALSFGAATALTNETAKKEKPTKSKTTVESKPTTSATPQQPGPKSDQVSGSTPSRASGRLPSHEKININKATAEELDGLPGIGPAKARAIIDYRTQNGDFKAIEDIQKVKGIKAGEFSKIMDLIAVTD